MECYFGNGSFEISFEKFKWDTVKPRNLLILGPSKTPQISKSAGYRLGAVHI